MFTIDDVTQKVIKKYPHRCIDIAQSFDKKQIKSKDWLEERFSLFLKNDIDVKSIHRVNIVGGWYGHQIIPIVRRALGDVEIVFYELDAEAIDICKNIYFVDDKNIKYKNVDATESVFSGNRKLTICTSCEHMSPLQIQRGVAVLQSNNYYQIDDHINCVNDLNEFKKQYNFKNIYFEGVMDFEIYKRFMIIGRV